MEDVKNITLNDKYRYNLYLNIKAIQDFLIKNNTQDIINDVKQIHILSFLIAIYKEGNTDYRIDDDGTRYIYVSSSFILGNLRFMEIKARQLQNILRQLELAKTIKRKIIDKNQRYLTINLDLLNLWHKKNWTVTATSYMNQYAPEFWASIKNEWQPILGSEKFKSAIDWCNDEINIQGIKYNNYNMITQLIKNTLRKRGGNLYHKQKNTKYY